MEIQELETHGRKLLVQFECYRCKTKIARAYKECVEEVAESEFRGLYDLNPPKGWKNGGFYYPLLCPECKKAYELFMQGENIGIF